jgi:hypothetical protein
MDAPRPRLPDVALPPTDGGEPVPLRLRRHGTVLVLLPPTAREIDTAYLADLAREASSLRDWDGRVFAVIGPDTTSPAGSPVPVLVDADRVVARSAQVDAPALVVADQWGEVHVREPATDAWHPVREIELTLRWLAIRCAG